MKLWNALCFGAMVSTGVMEASAAQQPSVEDLACAAFFESSTAGVGGEVVSAEKMEQLKGVLSLNLSGRNLCGQVAEPIYDCQKLYTLDLSDNPELQGALALYRFPKLQQFSDIFYVDQMRCTPYINTLYVNTAPFFQGLDIPNLVSRLQNVANLLQGRYLDIIVWDHKLHITDGCQGPRTAVLTVDPKTDTPLIVTQLEAFCAAAPQILSWHNKGSLQHPVRTPPFTLSHPHLIAMKDLRQNHQPDEPLPIFRKWFGDAVSAIAGVITDPVLAGALARVEIETVAGKDALSYLDYAFGMTRCAAALSFFQEKIPLPEAFWSIKGTFPEEKVTRDMASDFIDFPHRSILQIMPEIFRHLTFLTKHSIWPSFVVSSTGAASLAELNQTFASRIPYVGVGLAKGHYDGRLFKNTMGALFHDIAHANKNQTTESAANIAQFYQMYADMYAFVQSDDSLSLEQREKNELVLFLSNHEEVLQQGLPQNNNFSFFNMKSNIKALKGINFTVTDLSSALVRFVFQENKNILGCIQFLQKDLVAHILTPGHITEQRLDWTPFEGAYGKHIEVEKIDKKSVFIEVSCARDVQIDSEGIVRLSDELWLKVQNYFSGVFYDLDIQALVGGVTGEAFPEDHVDAEKYNQIRSQLLDEFGARYGDYWGPYFG